MKNITLLLIACMLLVSCGGKKAVKQVTQESKAATEAFGVAETIKSAFVKKDLATIQRNATEAGFKDITTGKQVFDSVDLTFTPRWVEIEGEQMHVNISWKSTWTLSGRKTEERGMAVFVMEGNPLKVTKIHRANPFILQE
ncbi:MAG: hypothetical protein Q8K68_11760 [Nitrospirota bacterium]|nr:hypothetical protein [Nitrospirota bacterium]